MLGTRHYNYLSHEYQNMIADVVYQRFFREQGNTDYTFTKLQNIGHRYNNDIDLTDFFSSSIDDKKIDDLLQGPQATFSAQKQALIGNLDLRTILSYCEKKYPTSPHAAFSYAKEFLAYCIHQKLQQMTDTFKKQAGAENYLALEKHLTAIVRLMLLAENIDQAIDQHYQHKYQTPALGKRFDDVTRFCQDKLNTIQQVADLRIYQVWIPKKDQPQRAEKQSASKPVATRSAVGRFFREIFSSHARQSEAESHDIAKALLGKNQSSNVHDQRKTFRQKVLAKLKAGLHYQTYNGSISSQNIRSYPMRIDFSTSPTPSIQYPNTPLVFQSCPKDELFFVLDGNKPADIFKNGITGHLRIYDNCDHALYEQLKYNHSRHDSKGNGLDGGEPFTSDYDPKGGWKEPIVMQQQVSKKASN